MQVAKKYLALMLWETTHFRMRFCKAAFLKDKILMFLNSEIKKKKKKEANLTCIYPGNTVFSKNTSHTSVKKTSYIRAQELYVLVHYSTSLLCWFSLYSKIVPRNKT